MIMTLRQHEYNYLYTNCNFCVGLYLQKVLAPLCLVRHFYNNAYSPQVVATQKLPT
jgi:hypothetical protein